jgi:hypothetical protein
MSKKPVITGLKLARIAFAADLARKNLSSKLEPPSEVEATHYEEQLAQELLRDSQSNRNLREGYAVQLFAYMCTWTSFVGAILILSGYSKLTQFSIPESSLNVLLGTTTLSVIGLVHAITRGLFPTKKDKIDSVN